MVKRKKSESESPNWADLLNDPTKAALESVGIHIPTLRELSVAEAIQLISVVQANSPTPQPPSDELEESKEEPKEEPSEELEESKEEDTSTNDPLAEIAKKIKIGGPALSTSQPVQSEEDRLLAETHDDWGQEVPAGTI